MNFKIEFADARERVAMAAGVQVGPEWAWAMWSVQLLGHTALSVAGTAAAATIFLSAMMLSATITAAAAITTAVAARADSGGGQWPHA
jgi:hypothetical protein